MVALMSSSVMVNECKLYSKVSVVIPEDNNDVAEQGDAIQSDRLWWTYTTQIQVSPAVNRRVSAAAEDLPGNSHGLVWQNN